MNTLNFKNAKNAYIEKRNNREYFCFTIDYVFKGKKSVQGYEAWLYKDDSWGFRCCSAAETAEKAKEITTWQTDADGWAIPPYVSERRYKVIDNGKIAEMFENRERG